MLGRFFGIKSGLAAGISHSSDLGFGSAWQGLGEIPGWVATKADQLRTIKQGELTAESAEGESRLAGEMQATASIMRSIAASRKKQLAALGKMAEAQIGLDQAAFQTSSQLAQSQAQAIGNMAQMDFQNRITGANLGGKVSTYQGGGHTFKL